MWMCGAMDALRAPYIPPWGVVEIIFAVGPEPAAVLALTLNVYVVNGLKPDTVIDVVLASGTGIRCGVAESGPITFTV